MSCSSSPIPLLTVEPPTPLPITTPSHGDLFTPTLPIPFLESLELLDPFQDAEKIDYNLLLPPGPLRRRRRSLVRKSRPSTPTSFVGISLLGIAAILLFTSIASIASHLNPTAMGQDGLMGRFRGKLQVALTLEVQGGAMLRDMTLGDLWTQVTHRERISEDGESSGGQLRAMSNDAWTEYREKRRVAPTPGLDLLDLY